MQFLKQLVRTTPIYPLIRNAMQRSSERREHARWIAKGRPIPVSHLEKQRILEGLLKVTGATTFVETGTYLGDMSAVMAKRCAQVHTIELSDFYFRRAMERFRWCGNVHLHKGDSGERLQGLVPTLNGRVLFWLDGHYSSGLTAKGNLHTPIIQELRAVFREYPGYQPIVAIDDARCFDGKGDYPTMQNLTALVDELSSGALVHIEYDIISIIPVNSMRGSL